MSDERPTVRPVTLARLVETTYLCGENTVTARDLEDKLNVSHRRARSTILEAERINLIGESAEKEYEQTTVGEVFIGAIQRENWGRVSDLLETHSPHYETFLGVVKSEGPIDEPSALELLQQEADHKYAYNQASIEVIGDWGERLGAVQRNAFTGEYYWPQQTRMSRKFGERLLEVYDDHEETAGVGMRQRHLSIPELREKLCSRVKASRSAFDEALSQLVQQNVGKLELSGAPIDTGAKDAAYGIKEIQLSNDGSLVSTSQSTDRVMAGIEQFDKRYYYLTVHDVDISYTPEAKS
jgi:hypothetical protein